MRPSGSRQTSLWHPFAAMATVAGREFVIARAEDVWVWDDAGNRYLDATASLWYCNVGHGRAEIIDAIAAQMRELDAYYIFGDTANPPALKLAERLAASAPEPGTRVMLSCGGGEGIESAAKLARRFWREAGAPERVHFIARTNAYHGTHGFGTSLAGIEANRVDWGPLAPETSVVSHDSVDELRSAVADVGPARVAAIFVEPVIGAGGVYPPSPGYLEDVQALCADTGILLVADCVICAFGRVGGPFGVERWGLKPDLLVFAKGVTSGYQPLGGVLVSPRVAAPFWNNTASEPLRHGSTYAGHPAACAAALANLDVLERDGLIGRGQGLEQKLMDALAPLLDSDLVREVRGGTGLMAAVEIEQEARDHDPSILMRLVLMARERGILVRALSTALAVSPPLTIETADLEMLGEALAQTLDGYEPPAASQ